MNQPNIKNEAVFAQSESLDLFVTALRFYRSAVRRKWVIILALSVSFSFAAAYYLTTTRMYSSQAKLIVLQSGGNALDEESGKRDELKSQMPNFEQVLQSDNVLKDAVRALPQEHLVDFAQVHGDRWIDHFRSRLSVTTLRNTNVIAVSFRSVSPESAYVVVGAVLDSYLKTMNEMHHSTAQKAMRELIEEKNKGEVILRKKEAEYLRLRSETQVIFGSGDEPTNVLSERVIQLSKELTDAKVKTANARALMNSIETAHQNNEDLQEFAVQLNEGLGMRLMEHHSGLSTDDVYTTSRIHKDLLDDQSKLATLMETRGRNHPEVLEMQSKIKQSSEYLASQHKNKSAALDKMSAEELGPMLVSLARRKYQLAFNHEQESNQQYIHERDEALRVGNQLAKLELLQNEISEERKFQNILLEGIQSKSLAQQSGINANSITPPSIDRRPVTPKLSVTVLMALVLGMFGGCAGVYIMDLVDDRFHSPDDLRTTIGSPILAMIRKLPVLATNGLESIYPYAKPNSVESEAFRTLRTAIDFSPEPLRRITISSTEPSDGKTTVMVSLAVAFAQSGKRTLVIDGDMRRPGTTRLFDLASSPGLSTTLKSNEPIGEVAQRHIHKTKLPGLDVLPAGPRPINPVELLASDRLAELISWAETQYDQLLIDAPPSLAVADVQVIGRLVDAAILTVRPDKNRRKMVIRAAEALTTLGCHLLGIVVNHVEPKHGGDYAYGYGYGYGYGEGYGHDETHPGDEAAPQMSQLKRAA